MSKLIDLTGQRFGRLTVVGETNPYISSTGKKTRMWLCYCQCGKEKAVRKAHLLNGLVTSCGCYHSENLKKRNTTHGEANTKLYATYRGIKVRCYDPNHGDFQKYGARGIVMCEEWKNNFQMFRDWAYANGYRDEVLSNGRSKWTIDRIDVNGNYEPSNCRWITIQEQQNNKNNNYRIEYNGRTQTIAEWAKELEIPYNTLHDRLLRYGWNIERSLTTRS